MSEDEAIRLVGEVKALFACNVEQMRVLRREFLRYDVKAVEAAITEQVRETDRLNIPQLLHTANEKSAGNRPTWLSTARAERQRSLEEQREIDSAFARLSDVELQEEKDAVLLSNAGAQPFLKTSDPRRSPVLRSLIFCRLRQRDR